MNHDRLEQVLQDIESLRDPDADPQLEALKVAILLEDVFGIRLSDADIDPLALADPVAIKRLVASRLDPA